MPPEHNTPATPSTAPDTAVAAPESGHPTNDTDPATGAAPVDGDAVLRDWEGLPPEARILVPAFATPMRLPDRTWAMLVLAVDIVGDTEPDRAGEVELFAGSWVPEQPPAEGLYDGDLVVRLTDPASALPREDAVLTGLANVARRGEPTDPQGSPSWLCPMSVRHAGCRGASHT